MEVGARRATAGDIGVIVDLYRSLEREMARLTDMWPRAGVGGAMMSLFFEAAASSGHLRLDGRVPPGHRAAKSFFESCGFTARRITLHRSLGSGPPRSGGVL